MLEIKGLFYFWCLAQGLFAYGRFFSGLNYQRKPGSFMRVCVIFVSRW
jgi:hypothetical protein